MPRYEFYCEDCKKPFEATLTLDTDQEAAAFFAVTSKKS